MTRPIKVAVVGGGCAAIATAFELSRPEHQGRYEVTVYQAGWRLGGKGASGRGPADRIEEHGLHLWMGFYENAFRLMRECYAELDRNPATCPIATWRDAFTPATFVGATDCSPTGEWSVWDGVLPTDDNVPGDLRRCPAGWTIADYLARSVALIRVLFDTIARAEEVGAAAGERRPDGMLQSPQGLVDGITRLLAYGELATLTAVLQAVEFLGLAVRSVADVPENVLLRLLDAISANARAVLEHRLQEKPAIRRVWQIIDLTLATIRGTIRSGLLTDPRGFDAIDQYDSREWLRLNGAAESSLSSGYIRALYDFGFSYEAGDATRPRISAGQALRSMVRAFFTFRGSFFWRMNAGMGDVVFAPFYEVLKRRGVRFAFFHRLENVKLAGAGTRRPGETPHVEALEFDVQATTVGDRDYEPLIDVHGLPSWPSEPDWTQLHEGERLRAEGRDFESHWDRRKAFTRTLRVRDDFDFVVLGVGLGAVPYVCREIVARDPRWRAMLDHVQTVATQAFQVWMTVPMSELGWPHDPVVLSGFVEPFDTWADMRHLLPHESWGDSVRSLGYFCSVLPDLADVDPDRDPRYLERQTAVVRANAVRFLNRDAPHLWPRARGRNGEFRWEVLADPLQRPPGPGEHPSAAATDARFDSQFWKANVNPSDRYVLSLPGSSQYRISPLDRTYDNLTVVGDWTDCGFNAGCVEAAVMSGRLGAHALSESPPLDDIIGYDHP